MSGNRMSGDIEPICCVGGPLHGAVHGVRNDQQYVEFLYAVDTDLVVVDNMKEHLRILHINYRRYHIDLMFPSGNFRAEVMLWNGMKPEQADAAALGMFIANIIEAGIYARKGPHRD